MKRFAFDGKFTSSPPGALAFTLSRPVATVDRSLGRDANPRPVGPDEPRFEPMTAIAGGPVFEVVRDTPDASTQLLGSGLDHDGRTPLLVVLQSPANPSLPHWLDVFSVAGDKLLFAEATGTGRVRTLLPPENDLLLGAVPNKAYRPTACAVCHGLIVMYCTVAQSAGAGQVFQDIAGAFVVSQDQGRTWTLTYESPAFSPGVSRGAPWSMQNWWPIERTPSPKQAFFVAADYCLNPGAPGGHTFLFRASRPTPGRPWILEPARVIYHTVANEHHHTGGVLPFGSPGSGGLCVFSVIGDLRRQNRIVSITRPDAHYLGADWAVQEDFHGATGFGNNPGIEGNQFVGCAPGPRERTVLAGSDLTTEQIMLLEFDDKAPSHPRTRHQYGVIDANGGGNFNFLIRTPTPELGGPYCANYNVSSTNSFPLGRRTLLSYDGEHWAASAAHGRGYQCIHAGHVYYDGTAQDGIKRSALPVIHVGRPLLVGPGGWQRQRAEPLMQSGGRMVALERDAQGRWLDGGAPIQPQPPCHGAVFKIATPIEPAAVLGYVYPLSTGSSAAPRFWPQLQARWWLMNPDDSRSASINVGIGFGARQPVTYRQSQVSSSRTWVPVDVTLFAPPEADDLPYLLFRPSEQMTDAQVLYVALDAFIEGKDFPGYPMLGDSQPLPPPPAHAGMAMPDEAATIAGFTCTPSWTITYAAQIPEDGIDNTLTDQLRWTLGTLWCDAQNYVEVVADLVGRRVSVEVTANGTRASTLHSEPLVFVRGSPILVSVAHRGSDGRLELTLSAAGQGVNSTGVTPPTTGRLWTHPREIRFYQVGAAPSASGISARVTPLQIWGGQVDERRFLESSVRTELITKLPFLGAGAP